MTILFGDMRHGVEQIGNSELTSACLRGYYSGHRDGRDPLSKLIPAFHTGQDLAQGRGKGGKGGKGAGGKGGGGFHPQVPHPRHGQPRPLPATHFAQAPRWQGQGEQPVKEQPEQLSTGRQRSADSRPSAPRTDCPDKQHPTSAVQQQVKLQAQQQGQQQSQQVPKQVQQQAQQQARQQELQHAQPLVQLQAQQQEQQRAHQQAQQLAPQQSQQGQQQQAQHQAQQLVQLQAQQQEQRRAQQQRAQQQELHQAQQRSCRPNSKSSSSRLNSRLSS